MSHEQCQSSHPAQLFETARLTVHARLEGDGSPLLFLGGSSFDLGIKAPVFDSKLAQHFTIVAADPRGLGRTDKPDGKWSMADYAADAIALMDLFSWQKVDILGESFGAMTALNLAHRFPGRINTMTLVAGAPGGQEQRSYPIEDLLLLPSPRERALAILRIQNLGFKDLEQDDPTAANALLEARVAREEHFFAHESNRAGYPRLLAARAGHDCLDALPNILTPTLIMAGEMDGQAPPTLSRTMARLMPNARLLTFPAGHDLCFATPEPVQSMLDHWVQTPAQPHQTGAPT